MSSEGSKLNADNIRKDYDHGSLSEHAPAETPYPYKANDWNKLVKPAGGEIIRRRNNRVRDNRLKVGVVNSPEGTQDRKVPGE